MLGREWPVVRARATRLLPAFALASTDASWGRLVQLDKELRRGEGGIATSRGKKKTVLG